MATRKNTSPNERERKSRQSGSGKHVSSKKEVTPLVREDKPKKSVRVNKLLQLPSIGVWEYDPATGLIVWSANTARLFQFREDRGLPDTMPSLQEIIYAEDRAGFTKRLESSMRDGTHFVSECRIRIPGRSFLWVEFNASPVNTPPRKRRKLIGSVQDVTSRKLSEFELSDWKTRNELVSESAGLLIYDYDLRSGDIFWSGNTEQVVGLATREISRIEQWQALIHPDDRDEAFRALEHARESLTPYDVHYRFRVGDRRYAHMRDKGMFVAGADRQAARMLGIMSDVSEQLAATRTIEQSEKSYRELFDCVGEAIYVQNPDGTFVDVNREACQMYGYTKEEMIGKTPEFLSAPQRNDFEKLAKQVDDALKGRPQRFNWWGRRKNGDIFLKEVRLTRATYFGVETVIATAWDITEKMEAERSLQESEKRFRRMVEDLNVGVILQGPGNEVQIANKNATGLLGIKPEELLKSSLNTSGLAFVDEEGEPVPGEDLPWDVAARGKKAVRGVVVGVKDGTTGEVRTWILVNAEPTLLEQEQLLHVLVTLTDITDQKRIEQSLKESELRVRTLQEASFGGIGLHNKGLILDCNQGLCDITGYRYEELIGSNGLELIVPEHRDYVLQKILNKDEEPYDVEGLRKDGSRYFLEIKGKNIPYGEGLIRVTEFRNITERKLAEAKILEQNARLLSITEDLKLRNEQLREFTQIVSHNLRAPVGNILSLLNFIENASTQEEQQEYVSLLKEAGTTTLTTLNELNEVLQIKQDKKIERQMLAFAGVFRHVRNMLNAKIAEAQAEIVTDFDRAPEVLYPNIYLESILLNLVSNALKYTYPGRTPVIRISTERREDNAIILSVADNGAGINLERYGDHIFKLRKTFHKHPESRGIGLFMIKNQIEAMGGEITLVSKEGEGSTFFITFHQPHNE